MRDIGTLLMALLLNLTVLYGQHGKVFIVNGDTLVGYNKVELQKIATKMVKSGECDTLLTITELQLKYKDIALAAKDSALAAKDSVISEKNNINDFNQTIITGQKVENKALRKENKKGRRTIKMLKAGWLTSLAALVPTFLYVLLVK